MSFYIFTKVSGLMSQAAKMLFKIGNKLQIKNIILCSYSFNNYSLLIWSYSLNNYSLLITVMFAHDVIRQDNIITCYLCGFVNK